MSVSSLQTRIENVDRGITRFLARYSLTLLRITVGVVFVWFGALTAVNLQTAFLSPPVAMSAYYLRNVVPQWSLATIYRGMADYMVIQCIALILVLFFPEIVLYFVRAARD